jgi:hypothetical protein
MKPQHGRGRNRRRAGEGLPVHLRCMATLGSASTTSVRLRRPGVSRGAANHVVHCSNESRWLVRREGFDAPTSFAESNPRLPSPRCAASTAREAWPTLARREGFAIRLRLIALPSEAGPRTPIPFAALIRSTRSSLADRPQVRRPIPDERERGPGTISRPRSIRRSVPLDRRFVANGT